MKCHRYITVSFQLAELEVQTRSSFLLTAMTWVLFVFGDVIYSGYRCQYITSITLPGPSPGLLSHGDTPRVESRSADFLARYPTGAVSDVSTPCDSVSLDMSPNQLTPPAHPPWTSSTWIVHPLDTTLNLTRGRLYLVIVYFRGVFRS